jgi:hypothetical protein
MVVLSDATCGIVNVAAWESLAIRGQVTVSAV